VCTRERDVFMLNVNGRMRLSLSFDYPHLIVKT